MGREVEGPDGVIAYTIATLPEQQDKRQQKQLATAMASFPADNRDVLMLVTVEGLSYEEAAQMGVLVGTIKIRASRARRQLAVAGGLRS